MFTNHPRTQRPGLMATTLLAGLALCASFPALAQSGYGPKIYINGGGAVASAPLIIYELELVDSLLNPNYYFYSYYPVTSTELQNAIINNDPTQFGLTAGSENVDFGATEQPLSTTQISEWSLATTGQVQAGNIIQIPIMGAALAIPVVNSAVYNNGQLALTDPQLCGIFSGKLTNWNQVSASIASGPITVVYRTDSSALSYQLTHHLSVVCTTGANGNSNFAPNFTPSTLFVNVFPNAKVPSTLFKGIDGLVNSADDLNWDENSAIGYISPDWTSLYPYSLADLGNDQHSQLVIAALVGGNNVAYLPTIKNITLGLDNPGAGAYPTTPPTNAQSAANPTLWLPEIPLTLKGYPIVSYSAMIFPQCFTSKNTANGLRKLLDLHYVNKTFVFLQQDNGYAQIANTPAAAFQQSVIHNILKNENYWNVDLEDTTSCHGLHGR